jgi:7-keto-8-aminopelargonate synthetase-like enzyme
MEAFDFAEAELRRLEGANLLRRLVCVDSAQGRTVIIAGKEKVVFCSNNYLGLANHPQVIEAVKEAIGRYGQGGGASRLISGTMRPHIELEKAFARLFGKEAALVLPSGWVANEAVIGTIAGRGDLLLLDKLDHASIIDAARSSEAEFRTYRRGSTKRLEKLLGGKGRRKFIITESIFSMDGDAADLKELVELKDRYGAYLDEVDIVVGTMSKALGSAGGVVAGKKVIIDLLINKARSFIYTTAATVANCAAAVAALEIVRREPQRRERLRENAEYLRERLRALSLNTGQSASHIIPVIIGGEQQAVEVSQHLFEAGYFVPAIRPPTVAAGTARLRVSVQSEHTKEQMDGLCEELEGVIGKRILPTLR